MSFTKKSENGRLGRLPIEVSTYLGKLKSDQRTHLEDLSLTTLADSQKLDVGDLWEPQELAITYWILFTTGVNQDEEMEIAKTLLFWKAFFVKEAARFRCIQTSERKVFSCCCSRFETINCPVLILGDSPNMEAFVKIEPELLFVLSQSKGGLHRFLAKTHQLIENCTSLRRVETILRSRQFWSSLNLASAEMEDVIAKSIVPQGAGARPAGAARALASHARQKWATGDFAGLARLIDRNAIELDRILEMARRALGSGFGDVISNRGDAAFSQIVAAIYEAFRCGTHIQYDYEPANPGVDSQQVRSAGEVLRWEVATCLDLALLFAAGLERAHVCPAVVIVEAGEGWHAMGGYFDNLDEATRAVAITNAVEIQRLVDAKVLTVVETTGLATQLGEKKPFARACEEAVELLKGAQPRAVLSVLAARSQGFLPW